MMTVAFADIVRRWAKNTPAAPVFSYQGRTVTWSEHDERANERRAAACRGRFQLWEVCRVVVQSALLSALGIQPQMVSNLNA